MGPISSCRLWQWGLDMAEWAAMTISRVCVALVHEPMHYRVIKSNLPDGHTVASADGGSVHSTLGLQLR